jgi:hypothetical protein
MKKIEQRTSVARGAEEARHRRGDGSRRHGTIVVTVLLVAGVGAGLWYAKDKGGAPLLEQPDGNTDLRARGLPHSQLRQRRLVPAPPPAAPSTRRSCSACGTPAACAAAEEAGRKLVAVVEVSREESDPADSGASSRQSSSRSAGFGAADADATAASPRRSGISSISRTPPLDAALGRRLGRAVHVPPARPGAARPTPGQGVARRHQRRRGGSHQLAKALRRSRSARFRGDRDSQDAPDDRR